MQDFVVVLDVDNDTGNNDGINDGIVLDENIVIDIVSNRVDVIKDDGDNNDTGGMNLMGRAQQN